MATPDSAVRHLKLLKLLKSRATICNRTQSALLVFGGGEDAPATRASDGVRFRGAEEIRAVETVPFLEGQMRQKLDQQSKTPWTRHDTGIIVTTMSRCSRWLGHYESIRRSKSRRRRIFSQRDNCSSPNALRLSAPLAPKRPRFLSIHALSPPNFTVVHDWQNSEG